MKNSVGKKLTLAFVVCMAVFTTLACIVGYLESRAGEQKIYSNYLYHCVSFVAESVNGVKVQELLDSASGIGDDKGDYYVIESKLKEFRECMALQYVYIYIPAQDGESLTNVYALGEDGKRIWKPGEVVYEKYSSEVCDVYNGKIKSAKSITNNQYGYVVTVYCPVYGPDGEIQAVAGVDMERETLIWAFFDKVKGTLATIITGCIIAVLVLLILSRSVIIRPLKYLAVSMERFVSSKEESGSFMRISMKSNDEFERISDVFNTMASDMEKYIEQVKEMAAEDEKRKAELAVAREIQEKSLPDGNNFLDYDKRFQINALMNAALMVGGDFYDFFLVGNDKLCVAVGDVSGKGISAALLMMRARTLLKENVMRGEKLSDALRRVNVEICEGNDVGMFVTVFLGILELDSGKFCYANAGHNTPYHGVESYSELHCVRSCPLGCFDDEVYQEESIVMKSGEGIFLYTDGVTEASSASGRFFGVDNMKRVLDGNTGMDCCHIIETMEKEIENFSENTKQSDDITMLMLRFYGDADFTEMLTVNADIDNLGQVRDLVNSVVGDDCPCILQLQLAVEEIFVNIASYAYDGWNGKSGVSCDGEKASEERAYDERASEEIVGSGKAGEDRADYEKADEERTGMDYGIVEITCSRSGSLFTIIFKDFGKEFNMLEYGEPEWKESIDEQRVGGFGISLVRKKMDEVTYKRENNANILIMKKKLEV